jgi:hypothetical protein
MTRRNLENNELGGVIREKINDNFIDLYNATGRGVSVLPTLATRFGVSNRIYNGAQFVDEAVTTTYSVTRNSTATYTDPTGKIRTAGVNEPRFTFDPETGEPLGLLVEEQRTRLNTISLLPTAPQAVTVTAAQHTISFYGTGSVVLSGAHSATLVGTGSGRVTLTFTPTAGTLTLTPSGSVNDLQLEVGANASSVIRGEGSAQTRLADNVSRTLGVEWNPNEGTLYLEFEARFISTTTRTVVAIEVTTNDRISLYTDSFGRIFSRIRTGGISYDTGLINYQIGNNKVCLTFKNGQIARMFLNGLESTGLTPVVMPSLTGQSLNLSGVAAGNQWNLGGKKDFRYYPRALSAAEAQALTKI